MNPKFDARSASLADEVERFLATGESDPLACVYPGSNTLERVVGYEHHLRKALINEVKQRERGRRQSKVPTAFRPTRWIRHKVEPMTRDRLATAPQREPGVAEP